MSEVALVVALGRLLSEREARAAFARDRASWIEAAGVVEGREALAGLDERELEAQATVLLEKRAGEVAERLPRTHARLGARYPELFARFAELAWPRGHLRHLLDARAFLRWLRREAPDAPHSLDELAVDSELARREGRGPVSLGLAHHADLPLSSLYLGLRVRGNRLRLLLPLPIPSALGRRLGWA